MFLAAVVQLNSTSDEGANCLRAAELVERAAGLGATLVATPENTNFLGPHLEKVHRAQTLDGSVCATFAELAREEGIFTGVSGGSTFAIAMQIAERAEPGSVILCMLPDTGERYLSSPMFEEIPEDMTDEEVELSLSTPGYHMPDA